jgi:DNA-directed RNA polymerase specialized sigma24 family protein
VEEFDVFEISAMLGVNVHTIRSRVRDGRRLLKLLLQQL